MVKSQTIRIHTINEFHRSRGLPKPEHPLVSIIDFATIEHNESLLETSWMFDFYQISVKRGMEGKMKYGQQTYHFEQDEGVMFFIAPNQVFKVEMDYRTTAERSGWMLLVHPDFFWKTSLSKNIHQYEFFDYSVNEALILSEKEEKTLNGIIANIRQEYMSNMDNFSQNIIVSHIETLLNYSERFYQRQFITRKKNNHQILVSLEKLLSEYFDGQDYVAKGLPTVQYVSEKLNVTVSYLSRLLKVLTGQSTQQHIHDKLIEKAKERLSTTNLTVSEIAYELGFEHAQAFSRLFKNKTTQSPLAFRQAFQ